VGSGGAAGARSRGAARSRKVAGGENKSKAVHGMAHTQR
jgi:hypothetical protein